MNFFAHFCWILEYGNEFNTRYSMRSPHLSAEPNIFGGYQIIAQTHTTHFVGSWSLAGPMGWKTTSPEKNMAQPSPTNLEFQKVCEYAYCTLSPWSRHIWTARYFKKFQNVFEQLAVLNKPELHNTILNRIFSWNRVVQGLAVHTSH